MDKNANAGTRASKKQQELYDFVESFIGENGYGPSYREIMNALDYKSVSTVAVHVNGLIKKGYLKKLEEGSARSLAIADAVDNEEMRAHQDWLVSEISLRLKGINDRSNKQEIADAEVLVETLRILDLKDAHKRLLGIFDENSASLSEGAK